MQYRMQQIGVAKGEIFYGRFQDDWVILSISRWTLKRAIREQHKVLQELKLELRPEKTFIGYATKGFDFLGYRIQQTKPSSTDIRVQKQGDGNSAQTHINSPERSKRGIYGKDITRVASKAAVNKSEPKSSRGQRPYEPRLCKTRSRETFSRVTIALSKTTLERFQKKRTRPADRPVHRSFSVGGSLGVGGL